jgi:transposase
MYALGQEELTMPRRAPIISCDDEQRKKVVMLANSRHDEARLVERARIVMACLRGEPVKETVKRLGVSANAIILWRQRFSERGIAGLKDRPRSGKPARYGAEFRNRVLKLLEEPPPRGQACWDGPAVAKALGASDDAVWRVLRKEGICLSRQRSGCVSTDPEFAAKAADIVGLYLNPPENALVISIDEKPSIQALERAHGYVHTDNGKIVRGFKSTYKRHGTLNLFAALEVATGVIHGKTTHQKKRVDFLAFMDEVVAELPSDREIHVILDNYSSHKKNGDWLAAHPNVFFHFTPTSASWLNQVEIWFGIFTRKALRGASFKNIEQLREAIEAYIEAYGSIAKPFVWRKREVKGSQLRNTLVNLCK